MDEHKRRASFICISFLRLVIGYSVWLLVSTHEKRKNPTVSLRLEVSVYKERGRQLAVAAVTVNIHTNNLKLSSGDVLFLYVAKGKSIVELSCLICTAPVSSI